MQVYSNELQGEKLTFKLYDSVSSEIHEYTETIVFENDMIIGDGFATLNLKNTINDNIVDYINSDFKGRWLFCLIENWEGDREDNSQLG